MSLTTRAASALVETLSPHSETCAALEALRFWDIHAGHADVEHDELVRAAVAELLLDGKHPDAVSEVAAGDDHGTATWDEFWATLYGDHLRWSA